MAGIKKPARKKRAVKKPLDASASNKFARTDKNVHSVRALAKKKKDAEAFRQKLLNSI